MDKITQIQAFVYVAETGSFAAAARQLKLHNSVVTKRVSQLEKTLEVTLFKRTTRKVVTTELGEVFYLRARQILRAVKEAQVELKEIEGELQGLLRVSCPSSFASHWLSLNICEFQHLHPKLQIELVSNERAVHPINDHYDVVVQVLPLDSANVITTNIAPAQRIVVASPQYLDKYGTPAHPTDLVNHRVCHNSYLESRPIWQFTENDGELVEVEVYPTLVTQNGWMMVQSALQGTNIAVLPTFFVEQELKSGQLVPLLLDYPYKLLWLKAYWAKAEFLPAKVRQFIDFLKAFYRPEPPWEVSLKPILSAQRRKE